CCSLTWLAMTVSQTRHVSALQFVYGLTMFNGVIDTLRGVPPVYVDGAYWTLTVEWKFYAIVLLFMLCRKAVAIEPFLWGWLAIACLYSITSAPPLDTWLIASWAPYFVAGAAAQLAQRNGWRTSLAAMIAIALVLCLAQARWQYDSLRDAFVLPGSALQCDLIICAMFVFFVTVAARRKPLWTSSSRSWPMLGGISYPLYLLHAGIGAVAFTLWCRPWNYWTFLLTLIPAMVLLAWAVHRYVEVALWGFLARRAMNARRAAANAT
ncbi:MAG: acyltransferase family protein, partial [Casimicrobiaceae bacterium]